MAKQTGLGANFLLAQYDLSGDVGAVDTISGARGVHDVTGLDKLGYERILGLRDGNLAFTGFWNTDAGAIQPVLKAMPTTDLLATIAIPTTAGAFAVGDAAASIQGKQVTFDPSRGQDGSLVVASSIQSNGTPQEWGQLLTTGKQSVATGTVNGTSIDYGATSTLFGAAAYLHVISIASGTMGVEIQDSADNITFLAVTGMTFTNVTAATSERKQGAVGATVRRYVRAQFTGTHGAAVVVVNFVRYLTSQAV